MLKKINYYVVGVAILFVVCASLFFFFDLDISKALYTENPSVIVKLYAAVGEFPIYIGPVLFGLVYGSSSKSTKAKVACHLVGLLATYVGLYRLTKGFFKQFYHLGLGIFEYALLALAALLIYVLLIMGLRKLKSETIDSLRDIALVGLCLSAFSFLSIEIIKRIWGRERFFALNGDYSEFTNFLTICGFKRGLAGDEFESFPSGHTSSASCLFFLTLIPMKFSKKKYPKFIVGGLAAIYVVSMAICRIIIGAHYASDVLCGFALNFTWLIVIYYVFKKKGWLHVRGN